jgi:hypothetical protein
MSVKKIILTVSVVIAALTVFALSLRITDRSIVARINGYPVTVGEFRLFLGEYAAETSIYFFQKYKAEDSADFWDKSFDGEIPGVTAKKKTLDRLILLKTEQGIMLEKDVIKDISYENFLKLLDSENKTRKRKVANKEPVFGPTQYKPKDYYDYITANRINQLKEKMADNELKTEESELLDYYEQNKSSEQRLIKKDNIKLTVTEVDINNRIIEGKEPEKMIFDDDTAVSEIEMNRVFYDVASELNQGGVSGIVKTEKAFYIIKCDEKIKGGYKSFDEVRNVIEITVINNKYNRFLAEKSAEAVVSVDSGIYNKIKIR